MERGVPAPAPPRPAHPEAPARAETAAVGAAPSAASGAGALTAERDAPATPPAHGDSAASPTPAPAALVAGSAPGPQGGGPAGATASAENELRLADGRRVRVLSGEVEAASALVEETAAAAVDAIARKGAFSLAVSGGGVARALRGLAKEPGLDFGRFHVFFCHDTIGEAGSHEEAQEVWLGACGVPAGQVHVVPDLPPEAAAAQYTATICMQDEDVIGDSAEGLPSVDLMLLCVGVDGGCGGIHPGSMQAAEVGSGKVVLFSEPAGAPAALAVSIDFMNASRRAVLLASGPEHADVVQSALSGDRCPAGLVQAPDTLWLATAESIANYTASTRP